MSLKQCLLLEQFPVLDVLSGPYTESRILFDYFFEAPGYLSVFAQQHPMFLLSETLLLLRRITLLKSLYLLPNSAFPPNIQEKYKSLAFQGSLS